MTTTSNRHAAPWTARRILAALFLKPQPRRRAPRPGVDHVLSGREAAARHLFGETVHWSRLDMLAYDNSPSRQFPWLAEADRQINHSSSPDRHVAAHWGYTPAEWLALPAIVQVDKREGFYQAKGLGA